MTAEDILVWIIIGAIAGFLAGVIVKGYGFGLVGNIIVVAWERSSPAICSPLSDSESRPGFLARSFLRPSVPSSFCF
jgi:hypothetical protein